MVVLRWALLFTVLVCVVTVCVTGIANGLILIAAVLVLALAWTLREPGDECDCPVDHSEALLDDEQQPTY